ncbi:hypothetical protein wcw_1660 [Waddlia chondrophila WSU 86-1044]|uniref:Uncharacterized protein n=1 Tax=Waddlia chondrophila (strain ATCC VR-1470 / WSU 86-1044) TaxID=716544 RepID=D6YSG0_WADCW|nr:hypothetical protein wcw_1660 [Waddlia chondrophila WSU 86-1044]
MDYPIIWKTRLGESKNDFLKVKEAARCMFSSP